MTRERSDFRTSKGSAGWWLCRRRPCESGRPYTASKHVPCFVFSGRHRRQSVLGWDLFRSDVDGMQLKGRERGKERLGSEPPLRLRQAISNLRPQLSLISRPYVATTHASWVRADDDRAASRPFQAHCHATKVEGRPSQTCSTTLTCSGPQAMPHKLLEHSLS